MPYPAAAQTMIEAITIPPAAAVSLPGFCVLIWVVEFEGGQI